MFEKYVRYHGVEGGMHPSVPRFHWQRLCETDARHVLDEFDNHYLGTWPDRGSLAEAIQNDIGWQLLYPAQRVLDDFEVSGQLELILDNYGVHAFAAPGYLPGPRDPNDGAVALPVPGPALAA